MSTVSISRPDASTKARSGPAQFEPNGALFFLLFFLACTALALLRAYPGDVHLNTAEIYMWSTLGFHLIYEIHPPLLPWIVWVLNHVVPVNYFVLAALAAFNVTLAAYAVWRIACLMLGDARAVLVIAIYWLSPYTLWHAVKLDQNSILLSTWALVVWALLLSLDDPKWWRGLILGLASAAALYAKYTSALLLVAAAVAVIASRRRATYFRTAVPYIAATTLILLIMPLAWAAYQDLTSTSTAATSTVAHILYTSSRPLGSLPTYMLTTNALRLLPVLAGFALLYYWIGSRQTENTQFLRELLIIVVLSYALIVGTTAGFGLRDSQGWPMAVFAFIPLLLVSWLRTPNANQLAILYRATPYVFCLAPVVGALFLASGFHQSHRNIVEPTTELARESASIWRRTVHRPVGIVAGDGHIDMAASLALPEHPRAWPTLENPWWITPGLIDQQGVLAFCKEVDTVCNTNFSNFVRERNGWTCSIEGRRSLWGMTGPLLRVHLYLVPPKMVEAEQTCTP